MTRRCPCSVRAHATTPHGRLGLYAESLGDEIDFYRDPYSGPASGRSTL
jgi:uncharacterized protein (DUF885 family)